jgi:hypothetical protein
MEVISLLISQDRGLSWKTRFLASWTLHKTLRKTLREPAIKQVVKCMNLLNIKKKSSKNKRQKKERRKGPRNKMKKGRL